MKKAIITTGGKQYVVTEGESLEANIALIKNNAKVAAAIAVALKENN